MGLFSKLFKTQQRGVVNNSFERLPIFHQTLQFPFPLSWPLEPLHRELDGGVFLLEFSAEGRGRDDWQEKLVIQGFNSANDDADMNARKLLGMMCEEMQSLDEESYHYEELFADTADNRQRVAALMGLRALPGQEDVAQFGLYMVIEGEHDIYIVQRAWKAEPSETDGLPMAREELEAWLEDFKNIALLDLQTMPEELL